jgi:SET domain
MYGLHLIFWSLSFILLGELVEKGLMRRLPEDFDGMTCPYIFTWSDDIPNKTWAMGSGTSAYYNTNKECDANTKMIRYFDEDRFEIFAERDIAAGEELTHTYKSLKWRTCFKPISEKLYGKQEGGEEQNEASK